MARSNCLRHENVSTPWPAVLDCCLSASETCEAFALFSLNALGQTHVAIYASARYRFVWIGDVCCRTSNHAAASFCTNDLLLTLPSGWNLILVADGTSSLGQERKFTLLQIVLVICFRRASYQFCECTADILPCLRKPSAPSANAD